jgi:hypothetical protein
LTVPGLLRHSFSVRMFTESERHPLNLKEAP